MVQGDARLVLFIDHCGNEFVSESVDLAQQLALAHRQPIIPLQFNRLLRDLELGYQLLLGDDTNRLAEDHLREVPREHELLAALLQSIHPIEPDVLRLIDDNEVILLLGLEPQDGLHIHAAVLQSLAQARRKGIGVRERRHLRPGIVVLELRGDMRQHDRLPRPGLALDVEVPLLRHGEINRRRLHRIELLSLWQPAHISIRSVS